MPQKPSRRELRRHILQLLPEARRAFPHDDPRIHHREVTTVSGDGITGTTEVEVLPNAPLWTDLEAALRADGVVEVAVNYYGEPRKPGLGRIVTSRHTAPKRLRQMNRPELLAVRRLLHSIVL